MSMRKINLEDGKYEIIIDLEKGIFKCLRHGEEWQDLLGCKLFLAMVQKLESQQEMIEEFKKESGNYESS